MVMVSIEVKIASKNRFKMAAIAFIFLKRLNNMHILKNTESFQFLKFKTVDRSMFKLIFKDDKHISQFHVVFMQYMI